MLLVDDKWTDTVKPLRKSIIETKGSQRNWGSPAVVSGWLIKRGRHRKAPTTHSSPHIVSWNVSMGYTLSMRVGPPHIICGATFLTILITSMWQRGTSPKHPVYCLLNSVRRDRGDPVNSLICKINRAKISWATTRRMHCIFNLFKNVNAWEDHRKRNSFACSCWLKDNNLCSHDRPGWGRICLVK